MTAPIITIHLPDLRFGMPGITPDWGGSLCEAASVCLEYRSHVSGVTMSVNGAFSQTLTLTWTAINQQVRNCYADMQLATELGAYGVAALLIEALTGLTVVERSRKGTGFDYWLARKGTSTELFQGMGRLEVSGILEGDQAAIRGRVRQKIIQVTSHSGGPSGYVVVVEFNAPATRVASV